MTAIVQLRGTDGGEATAGRIRVSSMMPQVGTELGLLIAEVPERFAEFLREVARLDLSYKRWEYVRGVGGIPGAGAELVGILPEGMRYTGFEGYWAGSGKREEAIVTAEAELGLLVLHHIAILTGTVHALAAGLDIFKHPRVQILVATALGQDFSLANLGALEPVFGELLARLRATAETCAEPERYLGFQVCVEVATQAMAPSIYSDPVQQQLLVDLASQGKNIHSDGIMEQYDILRAPLRSHHANVVRLSEVEQVGYHLLSEIGRLGHPVIRALLHVADWRPNPGERSWSP